MIKGKKVLSVFMSLVLVVGLMPSFAWATEGSSGIGESEASGTEKDSSTSGTFATSSTSVVVADTDDTVVDIADEADPDGGFFQFVYVAAQEIELGDAAQVAIGFTDESVAGLEPVLHYQNVGTGDELTVAPTTSAGSAVRYDITPAQIGHYALTTVSYQNAAGEQIIASLPTDEGQCSFVVAEASADGAVSVTALTGDDSVAKASELASALSDTDVSTTVTALSSGESADDESDINEADLQGYSASVIALDPGHAGCESGACGYGMQEADLTLSIAYYCKAALERETDCTVIMTRTSRESSGMATREDLIDRVNIAANAGADVFVSFHINAAGGTGFEVYVQNESSYRYELHTESEILGENIMACLDALGLTNDRGVKQRYSDDQSYPDGSTADYLSVLRNSRLNNIPAVLIEHGFIDNAHDVAFLSNETYLKAMGEADAQALINTYDLSRWEWDAQATASVDESTGSATIRVDGTGAPAGLTSVTVGVWGLADEQNDLAWYTATLQSDGSYVATVPLSTHGETGDYAAHVYASRGGTARYVGQTSFSVSEPTATVQVVSNTSSEYTVLVSNISSAFGVASVVVPSWSEDGNQDDLVWHEAVRQVNGSWAVTVRSVDHNYSAGTYLSHVYLRDASGHLQKVGEVTASLSARSDSIMGSSLTSVDQMVKRWEDTGYSYPSSVYAQYGAGTIREFCQILYEEATAEGVRAEVVFAQSMHETGWLQFGGDVSPEQCNFSGIGATGGGVKGNYFSSVREGLRAQVQHLKAYASTDALVNPCVDPRFSYVSRGCATTVYELGGKWAAAGGYGEALMTQITRLLDTEVPVAPAWYEESVTRIQQLGLMVGYEDGTFGPENTLTRAQAAVVLWRYFCPDAAAAYDGEMASTVNTTGMSDVESGVWYTGAANWAVANGVINGKGEGADRDFDPYGELTREQLCTIVANAYTHMTGAAITGGETKLAAMPDAAAVSDWATSSVAWGLDRGVISGADVLGVRWLVPQNAVSRAEMAAIMLNAIDSGVFAAS